MSVRLFTSLLYRSLRLQHKIEAEQSRPWPDRFKLIKLKKIRLALKDRMENIIRASLAPSQPQRAPVPVRAIHYFDKPKKGF